MPDVFEIPVNFAVLRRAATANRPSCFQIVYAQSQNWGEYHKIENVGWVRQDEVYPIIQQQGHDLDPNIHTLRVQRPGWPEQQVQKFWRLPYYFMRNGARIPVFDFQYSSWFPTGYTPIPIPLEQHESIVRFMNEVKQARCLQIHAAQEPYPILFTPPRTRTHTNTPLLAPPRRRQSLERHQQVEDDAIFAANIQSMLDAAADLPPSPRPPPLEIPPPAGEEFGDLPQLIPWSPPPIPEIVRQPLVLPKHVGDLILADARQGVSDCPIAAVPFRECSRLTVTSCFHVFDRNSLAIWMQDHETCPVCRTQIVNVIHE